MSVTTYNRAEEDFPRGGEDVVTPLEKRSLHFQAQQDVLFGKKAEIQAHKKNSVTSKVEVQSNEKTVTKQQYHNVLTEGMLLLGAIREIHQYNLIVSLPNNATGYVSIGNVSDPITEWAKGEGRGNGEESDDNSRNDATGTLSNLSSLFHTGQLVVCCVLSVQKSHVELSINPKHVNSNVTAKTIVPNMFISGWVSSIEDHGYLIDFGIQGKSGFLLKKNASEYVRQSFSGRSLVEGQVVNCLVASGTSARAIPVTISPQSIQKGIVSTATFLPLSSLLPGILVNATVGSSTEYGLTLSFLESFEGLVSISHLTRGKFDTKLFPVGKKVRGRLVWVDVLNKKMGLSLQQHIVEGTAWQGFVEMEIGQTSHTSKVVSVHPQRGIILELDNGMFGYSPLRLLYEEQTDKVQKVHTRGSVHQCRVIQFNLIDGFAVVSLKQSILEKKFMKLSDIKPGACVDGEVKVITEKGVFVKLGDSFSGFCPNSELSDSGVLRIRSKLAVGSSIKCRVLTVDMQHHFILLTCRKSLVKSALPPLSSFECIQPGDIHDGTVVAVLATGLVIRFYNKIKGFAHKSELNLSVTQASLDLSRIFKTNQIVRCRVLNCSPESERLFLSLNLNPNESVTEEKASSSRKNSSKTVAIDKRNERKSDTKSKLPSTKIVPMDTKGEHLVLVSGDVVEGVVLKVVPNHRVRVSLPHPLPGVLDITDISDHFVHDPLQYLKPKQQLKFHVVSVDKVKVTLSLRRSRIGKCCSLLPEVPEDCEPDIEIIRLCDLEEGQVVKGYVKAVGKFGVFIRLGRNVFGRVMICNISDRYIKNYESAASVGSLVRAKVLSLNKDKHQVELSLKLSDIDPDNNPAIQPEQNKTRKGRKRKHTSSINEDTKSDHETAENKKPRVPDTSDDDEDVPALSVTGGFEWEENDMTTGGRESSGEEAMNEDKPSNKKTRRQKKATKNAEESFLYEKEFQLLESTAAPTTADDFDRQLAITPNSSAVWLQYMAFYLHLADIEKARTIARKALSTISFREEQEKLNVWYGLLNLENLYGTQESLMKTFQEALQSNEPLPLYHKLAGIYLLTEKKDMAEQVYQTMSKKFSGDCQVWIKYGLFQMQNGQIEAARKLMKKSLKNLTKQNQVMIISKFAQFEFKFGDPERGRTMFESLLSSYPKRVDLWSVYIDMMTKTGKVDIVRDILERSVSLKVSVKKAKFLFKKYLAFEESHGTSSTVKSVKDKAKAYVLSRTSELETD